MMTFKELELQEAYERRLEREREDYDYDDSDEDESNEDSDPDYEYILEEKSSNAAYDWFIQNARG